MFACDIDGVVANFVNRFSKLLNKMDGRCPILQNNNEAPTWDWKDWYAPELPREEVSRLIESAWNKIKSGTDSYFWCKDMEPLFPETMPLLARCAKEEPIIFITRRDGVNPWGDTILWLRRHDITNPLLYVVKPGEEKGDVCKKLGIDVIIDDAPKYADEILSHGHKLIMPIWKYNQDYLDENLLRQPNLYAANTLGEALTVACFISRESRRS